MKLTTAASYALHAVAYMAAQKVTDKPVASHKIAQDAAFRNGSCSRCSSRWCRPGCCVQPKGRTAATIWPSRRAKSPCGNRGSGRRNDSRPRSRPPARLPARSTASWNGSVTRVPSRCRVSGDGPHADLVQARSKPLLSPRAALYRLQSRPRLFHYVPARFQHSAGHRRAGIGLAATPVCIRSPPPGAVALAYPPQKPRRPRQGCPAIRLYRRSHFICR